MVLMIKLLAALRGAIYASGFVLLWWWVVMAARSFDPRINFSIPQWARVPGLIMIVLGSVIAVVCIAAFAFIGKGTPAPFDAPREFVASGPYKYVRNPMYIGALTVIFGSGLIMRSPSALLVALGFVLLAHIFVLVYEEPTLEHRFGESYLRYKRSVPRWLPLLTGFKNENEGSILK